MTVLPRFDTRTAARVVLVGVAGGFIGAAYVAVLHLLERPLGPAGRGPLVVVFVLVAVGAGIGVITRLLGDPGDVELLVDNIHVAGGSRDLRALRSLLPASLLGIAAGGALGPEAPLVQTAGTVGTLASGGDGDQRTRRHLTIAGMAAGFAVLFGAPMGSAVFALEILHRRGLEYYEALIPALCGALVGFMVYVGVEGIGYEPILQLPDASAVSRTALAWGAVAGVIGGVLAVAFTGLVAVSRRLAARLPTVVAPAVGGLLIGLLSLWSAAALTYGETQIGTIALGAAAPTLAAAIVTKLTASSICLATGWKGGFIIPLFFAGAAAGQLLHLAVPSAPQAVLMAACMVATTVGVTKTPLGSTLVVAEMAGIHLLPSTVLAAVISLVLTSEVRVIRSQRGRTPAP